MKIKIAGLKRAELARYIRKNHRQLKIVREDPEVIICYGGDGTLLYAERNYPGIPKAMVRHSQVCDKCGKLTRQIVLKLLEKEKFSLQDQMLIEVKVKRGKLLGLNDIVVGHEFINTVLRFKVYLNDTPYGEEYLGDGLIVATPLGSTGYYQCITHSTFEEGLGIAFNNAINIIGHLVVKEDTVIKVEITRGPGIVVPDNAKKFVKIDTGDKVIIKKSKQKTQLVVFDGKKTRYNISLARKRAPLGYCQICGKQF